MTDLALTGRVRPGRAAIGGVLAVLTGRTVPLAFAPVLTLILTAGIVGTANGQGCRGTTPSILPQIACTADPHDHRSNLIELLTSSEPSLVQWRTRVGLAGEDPNRLTLVTSDSTCNTLWWEVSSRMPSEAAAIIFFKLGDFYLITEYVKDIQAVGWDFTSVVDDQFQFVAPTLAQ